MEEEDEKREGALTYIGNVVVFTQMNCKRVLKDPS